MIHYTAIMLPGKCIRAARVYMSYLVNISKSMEMRLEGAYRQALHAAETVLSLCGKFYGDICMYSGWKDSFPGQCMRKDS